jgi:4-aminobutyrate aminotransferase-like enzyme/Ser/Thr protein kinase RdoA (MazF antagonist)
LLALRTSPPAISHAEGERIAREIYGLAATAQALPGERDCNFRLECAGREFVLKILDAAGLAQSADCLASALDFLAEVDPKLPVPRLIPTMRGEGVGRYRRDGIDYDTCLVSFLPGRCLAESTPSAALLRNMGGTLARIDRALQGFFHPFLGRPIAWDVRRLPELVESSRYIESSTIRAAVQQAAGALRERLPALRRFRSQAIHGDCHAMNLLVDEEGASITGILDFGDMIHAPPIVEVGVALSELLTEEVLPLESVGTVLEGFAQGQSLIPAEIDALFDIIAARHAAAILVHAWRCQHDPSGAALLHDAAARAGDSLQRLLRADRVALTRVWQAAAMRLAGPSIGDALPTLERRHRLMGAGAELFYAKPLHFVRGEALWLYDAQGRAYLDVYNNVAHVGHCHPQVVEAVSRQSALLATHTRYLHEGILEYAEQLTALLPAHLNACIFVNSGSEANDVAWRIAKMASGGRGALIMQHAYHGITDAVGALTPGAGQPSDPRVFALAPPPALLRAGDELAAAEMSAAVEDVDLGIRTLLQRGCAPAAFFIDSALTSTGIFDAPTPWAKALAGRVHDSGALIVADEVQYGFGRCGSNFWGFERRGFSPDIVTLGKPVGNGYPMGVVIANRELIEAFQAKFGFFSTFGGNAVAAAAGLAVLQVLKQERLQQNAHTTGCYLRDELTRIAARHACLGEVRGNGLLQGLTINASGDAAAKHRTQAIVNALAAEFGVLIGSEGPGANVLKLRPPMSFAAAHVDLLVHALDTVAARVT